MSDERRVVLVSSDARLTLAISNQLMLTDGIEPVSAGVGDAMRHVAAGNRPALWLIDDRPDAKATLALVQSLRELTSEPILLLSGPEEPAGDLFGETDEVILKPFRLQDLLSRIAVHLADREAGLRNVVRIGPYEMRIAERLLVSRTDERRIRLTEKEVAILEFLADTSETTSRDALLHEVWGYQPGVTSHTLETHVYRLRQKIEPDPSNAMILISDAGGYRLAS